MPKQKYAGFVEHNKARVEIVQVRPPAYEADDIAAFQFATIGKKTGAGNNGHRELPPAEPRFGIDCLVYVDRAAQVDPATHIVFDIVLAPFKKIVIAFAPGYGPIVIANIPQDCIELAAIAPNRGSKNGVAKCDAIKRVVAYNEFFRSRRTAYQCVAEVRCATQGARDEVDSLRNRAFPAGLLDKLADADL